MENFVAAAKGRLQMCDFTFTENGKDYECRFIGGNKIDVTVFVDDNFENNFIAECKSIPYNDYYSFCQRIAEQIMNKYVR